MQVYTPFQKALDAALFNELQTAEMREGLHIFEFGLHRMVLEDIHLNIAEFANTYLLRCATVFEY